jgi:hypothetical protein
MIDLGENINALLRNKMKVVDAYEIFESKGDC